MTSRRTFLSGMIATGLVPSATWADLGMPRYLSAARTTDGRFVVAGLSGAGEKTFEVPLPVRGHAAAAHPVRTEAVAFARRPGTDALVLECRTGKVVFELKAPSGRHFYGHGVFSADGDLLFTTENDFETARGLLGIWDVRGGYRRVGEFASGGVGPHDIRLLPRGQGLVVANGGIETHPETGRAKLNLASMRPNLSTLSIDGVQGDIDELDPALHRNSIRHLSVARDGRVAFAMQWQGNESEHPPLLGLKAVNGELRLLHAGDRKQTQMRGYAGSVAFDEDGHHVAITSPRGGLCHVFNSATGALVREVQIPDVCGIASNEGGFVLSSGQGRLVLDLIAPHTAAMQHTLQWDNHLVDLGTHDVGAM